MPSPICTMGHWGRSPLCWQGCCSATWRVSLWAPGLYLEGGGGAAPHRSLTPRCAPPCRAHQAGTAAPRSALVGHHQADIVCVPSGGHGAFRGVSHQGNTVRPPPPHHHTENPLPPSAQPSPLCRSAETLRGGRVPKPPRCCWHGPPPSTAGSPSSCCRKATCRDTEGGGTREGAQEPMRTPCVGVPPPGGDNK